MEPPEKTTSAIIGGALVGAFALTKKYLTFRRSLVRSLMDRVETLEKRVEHLEQERLDVHAMLADEKLRHAQTSAALHAALEENRVLRNQVANRVQSPAQ